MINLGKPQNYRREKIIKIANDILDLKKASYDHLEFLNSNGDEGDSFVSGSAAAYHLVLLKLIREFDITEDEVPVFGDGLTKEEIDSIKYEEKAEVIDLNKK